MDWFERLTGFSETTYSETKACLSVTDGRLRCPGGREFCVGSFAMPSLSEVRSDVAALPAARGGIRVSLLEGDVRRMHQTPDFAGALFQVASQFNMLEMTGPGITPEAGVGLYERDPTQGPACAIAAGAATIFRNYFVPMPGGSGQTESRQLNGLADLGAALADDLHVSLDALWHMRNGYALCTPSGLAQIDQHLGSLDAEAADALRGRLRIGVHRDVEVTDSPSWPGQRVSQAFCSALPVAYSELSADRWANFARLVLEASYEATLLVAALAARKGGSNMVLLTQLGGGAFGNDSDWIMAAMERALQVVEAYGCDLDVRLVTYSGASPALRRIAAGSWRRGA